MKDLIAVDPSICHGQPCFAGTRIMVWQILELLEAGISQAEITSEKYFPQLSTDHIKAALHYAAEQFKNRDFIAFSAQLLNFMRFFLDENIPGLVEKTLKNLGHETYRPAQRTSDHSIYLEAEKCHAVILTRDRDFLNFIPSHTRGIIYIKIHPSVAEKIMQALEKLLKNAPEEDYYGKVILLQESGHGTLHQRSPR